MTQQPRFRLRPAFVPRRIINVRWSSERKPPSPPNGKTVSDVSTLDCDLPHRSVADRGFTPGSECKGGSTLRLVGWQADKLQVQIRQNTPARVHKRVYAAGTECGPRTTLTQACRRQRNWFQVGHVYWQYRRIVDQMYRKSPSCQWPNLYAVKHADPVRQYDLSASGIHPFQVYFNCAKRGCVWVWMTSYQSIRFSPAGCMMRVLLTLLWRRPTAHLAYEAFTVTPGQPQLADLPLQALSVSHLSPMGSSHHKILSAEFTRGGWPLSLGAYR